MFDECRTEDAFKALVKQIQDRADYVKPTFFGIYLSTESTFKGDTSCGTWLIQSVGTNFGSAAVFWAACGYPEAIKYGHSVTQGTQAILQNIGRAFSWIVGPGWAATPTGLAHLNVQVVVRLLRELKPEDFSKLWIILDYGTDD